MTRLSISVEGSLDPAARIEVGPDGLTISRTIIKDLWRPDRHVLVDALFGAPHRRDDRRDRGRNSNRVRGNLP